MANKLSFRVHRVTCIDETGGKYLEKIGNDEIYLAGFAVNEAGGTVDISPFSVYPHFDDGDVKVYNPPKTFYTFSVTNSGVWPKRFGIGLVLVEKDAGNLLKSTSKIINASKAYIKNNYSGVIGPNPPLPPRFPRIPSLTKLIASLKYDIFYPQLAIIDIPAADFRWSGSNCSIEKTVNFQEYGGHYALVYDWMLT